MKRLTSVLLLLILGMVLVGCGLDTEASSSFANSMGAVTSKDLSQLPFVCDGRVVSGKDGSWRAQVMFKVEIDGAPFTGGGAAFFDEADAMPKGAFRCEGVANVEMETMLLGKQSVERTQLEVTKLSIFADGFESGDVGFKTATIVGTSFKGTDEELQ